MTLDATRLLGSSGQYSRYPLGHFTAAMAKIGITRLDFVPQTPHFWLGHTQGDDPAALRAELDRAGLAAAVLTPPPYRYAITAPKGIQRSATLAYYTNALALARTLGANRLVLGAAGACWDTDPTALWSNARDVLAALCTVAEKEQVSLLLCPVMGPDTPLIAESPILGTARDIARMLNEVNHPRLAAALDTNVMSAVGDTLPGWFELLGARTQLVRLADGNYHGWRALGEGCLPMASYLAQLGGAGYTGDISLLLPGERYIECPEHPDQTALRALCGEVRHG